MSRLEGYRATLADEGGYRARTLFRLRQPESFVSGFYVLHVREFEPLVEAARRNERCRVHDVVAGYRFIEFTGLSRSCVLKKTRTRSLDFWLLTAGLDGKITEFTEQRLCIRPRMSQS